LGASTRQARAIGAGSLRSEVQNPAEGGRVGFSAVLALRGCRRLLFAFFLGIPALQAGVLLAQTAGRPLPVEEMAQSAQVIGVATVRSAQTRKDVATGLICTDFTLAFAEVWKGSPSDPFILVKAGGTLGGQTSAIVGREYKLEVGESLVLFATRSLKETYAVIGLRQGLYRMGEGADPLLFRVSDYPGGPGPGSNLRLGSLREQVFGILSRPRGPAPGETPTGDLGTTRIQPGGGAVSASFGESPPVLGSAPTTTSVRSRMGLFLVLGALGAVGAAAILFRKKL